MYTRIIFFYLLLILPSVGYTATYRFLSDGYLKAVEMHVGDTLFYTLKNGQQRSFTLLETSANPLFTFENPDNRYQSGIVYRMHCKIASEGQELDLIRIVSAQQSYYEPWHINGVTFFFDAVKDMNDFIYDNHGSTGGSAYPKKDARFAFIEYEDDFASQVMRPWYPNPSNFLSIKESYTGANSWLGGYLKTEAHNGLDVNIPNNTMLWAPIDFDDQYYFNSLEKGDNNNRWMGIKTWPNGEKWILRTHHMVQLLVEQHTPLSQGTLYGTVGGVHYGTYPHIHFYFIWENDGISMALDPWMIFWKIFENNKKQSNQIRAVMNALNPVKVGEKLLLNAEFSSIGLHGPELQYFWSVNDGSMYEGPKAEHTFLHEGMHVVSLTITNGADTATVNQHISVLAGKATQHYFKVASNDPFDCMLKTTAETETYGKESMHVNNKLHFFFRKDSDYSPHPKTLTFEGDPATLQTLQYEVEYLHYEDWIELKRTDNKLQVLLIKEKLSNAYGEYQARIRFWSESSGISQHVYVKAMAPERSIRPQNRVVVDDKEALFYPSGFYWVEEPYDQAFLKGYGTVSFWAGGDDVQGIARYQPELREGTYKISMNEKASFEPAFSEIPAGIIHLQINTTDGLKEVYWDPKKDRIIGTFKLFGGKDSYVDVITEGSTGQIYLDALVFERIDSE
ncbi:MAG: PKD domain-containing protein [Cyclobacteriaceae bacterium]|nr:PKD domain-containing protein [Cyclobacteriaceae bacterium]